MFLAPSRSNPVTMHLDDKHNALLKTHNQKRNVSRHIETERRYNLATPLTIPTATYTTSSTSSVMHAQLSSIEGRNVKKMKLTVQHPTIDYPTTVSATCANGATTVQSSLHHPSNRRVILSTADYMHNDFCILKQSTRVSSASTSAKL